VFTSGAATITGASVEIRVLAPQELIDPSSDLSYWVGISLPNDAFIQAGQIVLRSGFSPAIFWEYYPPETAREASAGFLGYVLGSAGANGTWVKFRIETSDTIWSAYAGNQKLGSEDLKISTAIQRSVYAVAEIAATSRTDNILGPVEFRNLSYRDTSGMWHVAESGTAYIGLGAGSGSNCPHSSDSLAEVPGVNNYWIAGSISRLAGRLTGLQTGFVDGDNLWPWHKVAYGPAVQCDSPAGFYLAGYQFKCQVPAVEAISMTERSSFSAWSINGATRIPGTWYLLSPTSVSFTVSEDTSIDATYVKQLYLDVSTDPMGVTDVTGSGWYAERSSTSIVSVPHEVDGSKGTKYVFTTWTVDGTPKGDNGFTLFMDVPHKVVAKYDTMFLLTIVSDYGNPRGRGYHKSGEPVVFGVDSPVGIGIQHVFVQWSGDYTGNEPQGSITMDGPKTVSALWTTNYTQLYVIIVVVAIAVVGGLLVCMKRRARQPAMKAHK
jgi:hypothetical protein